MYVDLCSIRPYQVNMLQWLGLNMGHGYTGLKNGRGDTPYCCSKAVRNIGDSVAGIKQSLHWLRGPLW